MNNPKHNISGTVTVSLRAASQAAEHIIKTTAGVAELVPKRGLKYSLRAAHGSRCVYFSSTEKGLNIEIYIITSYGVNVNKVCSEISNNIRLEFENNMGIPVNNIKVLVEGVKN